MSATRQTGRHAYRLVAGALLALALGGRQPAPPLKFTRPTVVATHVSTEPVFFRDRLIYEDGSYKFGDGDQPGVDGFVAYSKQRKTWIHIRKLSTEHARLGRSAGLLLAMGWDHGSLINQPYASIETTTSLSAPDRIVPAPENRGYRIDFHSSAERDFALTSFWVTKADLEDAFDGRRTPELVESVDPRAVPFEAQGKDGLIVAVQLDDGEWLRWRIDPARQGIHADPHALQHGIEEAPTAQASVRLRMGAMTLDDQLVSFGPVSRVDHVGGILGTTLFDRFLVSLDYDAGRVRLIEPVAGGARGEAIATRWTSGSPIITAQITTASGPSTALQLCVETTESRALVLRRPVAAARIASLRIGPFRFDNLPVFSDTTIAAGCDGVLGNGLLRRFTVTFDRPHQRLLLAPGALFDVPYDYDLTGLTIVANGRAFGIGAIEYGTIAATAGLRAGDWILELDGKPVAGMTLAGLRQSFRHDGRERVLTIQRAGNRHIVRLQMPLLK